MLVNGKGIDDARKGGQEVKATMYVGAEKVTLAARGCTKMVEDGIRRL